jgi:hypothetical protein
MTRTRHHRPWPLFRRPARRLLGSEGWRHEDHLAGERLPEASHVARGLR